MYIETRYDHSDRIQMILAEDACQIGFRLCQYKIPMDLNEYYAALFCFSLIDNSLCDELINSDETETKSTVQSAISGSPLLRSHVEFVLSYSPVIDWNGGQ